MGVFDNPAALINPVAWFATAAAMGDTIMTNEANANQASMNKEWQGDQIRSAREYEERMSNTSHAREVSDLKNAGLNPILAVNGGASTPSASGGSGAQATMEKGVESAMGTAMEIAKTGAQIKNTEANTELQKAQKNKTNIDAQVSAGDIPESKLKNTAYDLGASAFGKARDFMSSQAPKDKADINVQRVDQKILQQQRSSAPDWGKSMVPGGFSKP